MVENVLEEKSLKSLLKEKIIEHMLSTHLHGLPHIIRNKHLSMKILWIAFFIGFTSISFVMISNNLIEYFNYSVVTNIMEHVEREPDFPSVTICAVDPFVTKAASDYIESKFPEYFNISFSYTTNNDTNYDIYDVLSTVRFKILNEAKSPNFSYKSKQKFGYGIKEIIIRCNYDDKPCGDTGMNFKWYYSFYYGNCYTFNSGFTYEIDTPDENSTMSSVPLRKIRKPGENNGLSIEMYSGSRDAKYSLEDYGAIVFIHNQSRIPESSLGIFVQPGTAAKIVFQKIFNHLWPYPYSECHDLSTFEFDRSLYNVFGKNNFTYTASDCFNLCLQKQIISACSCYYDEFFPLDDSRACLTDDDLDCVNLQYSWYEEKNTPSLCSLQCPLECYSLKYDYTISNSGYPSDAYAKILRINPIVYNHYANFRPTMNEVKRDVLSFKIFAYDFKYTQTIESPQINAINLFSNIGGKKTTKLYNELLFSVHHLIYLPKKIINSSNKKRPYKFRIDILLFSMY